MILISFTFQTRLTVEIHDMVRHLYRLSFFGSEAKDKQIVTNESEGSVRSRIPVQVTGEGATTREPEHRAFSPSPSPSPSPTPTLSHQPTPIMEEVPPQNPRLHQTPPIQQQWQQPPSFTPYQQPQCMSRYVLSEAPADAFVRVCRPEWRIPMPPDGIQPHDNPGAGKEC